MTEAAYFFDTSEDGERARLEAQTALWDPFTFRRLDEVGVAGGWRCLEVGGGTGSVAGWLVDRVGDSGHVVATDLETRWIERLAGPNCEVRRHDVAVDPIEESRYDLVHTRLVLMHLPERDAIVDKLAAALRPGGWLIVDDYDLRHVTEGHPPDDRWTKVSEASLAVLQSVGADPRYGIKLPAGLRAAGLADVDAEGRSLVQRGPESAPWLVPLLERMREPIIASGAVSDADVDYVIGEIKNENSERYAFTPLLVSARGRRPLS